MIAPIAALVVGLPVLFGGLVQIAAIKRRFLPALAAIPLDGGLTLRGRRVFGANKTLRGALVMVAGTAISAWFLDLVGLGHPPWAPDVLPGLAWGALMGLGYILGELPNSFLKRQLGIAPGAPGQGRLGPLFWVADQLDSFVGVLAVLVLLAPPSPMVVLWMAILSLVVHPAVAFLMKRLGLKSRVG